MKKYTEINGWFDYEKTYDFLLSTMPEDGIFVECGAWLGKSSAYLCDKASLSKTIYIVDSWLGSANEIQSTQKLATKTDIYNTFMNNMGNRNFIPVKMQSDQAVLEFEDESCDVVFIDMEHTYEAVKNDIQMWLPKVKKGGYLAGHDYQSYWPGVIKAVNENFAKDDIICMDTCWIFHKL